MKVKLAAGNNAIDDKTTVHRRETIFRLGAWLIRLRAGFAVVCKETTNSQRLFIFSYSMLINTVIKWEVVFETDRTSQKKLNTHVMIPY